MIEVHNRVPSRALPNGALRFEEFDENGKSLGYRWIKRADEPIEEGTRLTRDFFDSILEEDFAFGSLADCQVEVFRAAGVTSSYTYTYKQAHLGTPIVLAAGSATNNMVWVTGVTDKRCTVNAAQPNGTSTKNDSQTIYGVVISGRGV